MISRVAEHCFWMSRYLERAENTARVLDVNQSMLLDFELPLEQQWKPLLIITGCHFDEIWADPASRAVPDSETVQNYLTWERANLSSIASTVAAARENARVIRDVISIEMWERLNYFYLWLQGPTAKAMFDRSRSEFYKQIKEINQTFHGITDGTMSHGEAWEFIQLGKYLERACQTARIVDVKYHVLLPDDEPEMTAPVDAAHWTAVLKSCSGYEPFHKQKRSSVGIDPGSAVAEFLIFDEIFPRSVLWCLKASAAAARLTGNPTAQRDGDEVERQIQTLLDWLAANSIDAFMEAGLHESMTRLVNGIHDLGEVIRKTYFQAEFELPAAAG